MRLLLLPLLLLAGCAASPEEEAERSRERSRSEIRRVVEEVIAAMREGNPEVYHARLCRAQREGYPLADMKRDWEDNGALLRQRAAGLAIKTVEVDRANPNAATILLHAPNHPVQDLMFLGVREDGVWKLREARVEPSGR